MIARLTRNLVGLPRLFEVFDAPDETAEPGAPAGEVRIPHRQNLRTLIYAFESFFGFGDCLNWRDPEVLCTRGVQRDLHPLPTVFHAQGWAGNTSGEAKILFTVGRLEESISGAGGEKIRD